MWRKRKVSEELIAKLDRLIGNWRSFIDLIAIRVRESKGRSKAGNRKLFSIRVRSGEI